MRYFIITGASSGLGEALAKNCIINHDKVFCISRKVNKKLKVLANELHTGFWYFEQDLTVTSKIPGLLQEIFSYIDSSAVTDIILINNAGVVEPIKPLGKCNAEEITKHIEINLTVPVIFTNEFIKNSLQLDCNKTIINISSGAASNPYFGWTLYCSTKAGLDMMTQTVGLENEFNNVRVLSIAPGVLDTNMQDKLREVEEENFPMKHRFVKLFEEEKLIKPDVAAKNIFHLIQDPPLTGSITDLRKINQ